MPWTPEDGNTLTAAHVDQYAIEETTMKLWHEFLSGWFNGLPHLVGYREGDPLLKTFPAMDHFTAMQMPMAQNLDGFSIGVVHVGDSAPRRRSSFEGVKISYLNIGWTFFLRASVKTRTDGQNSAGLVRLGADLLHAILTLERTTSPLRARGLHRLRCAPARLISSGEYAMRSMHVRALLIFTHDFNDVELTTDDYEVMEVVE
jgi:hypothetical protein